MRTLRDLLHGRELNRVYSSISVLDAAKFLVSHNTGTCAVFESTRLVGVFSERDLLRRVVAFGRNPAQTAVMDVMTRDPVIATVDETLDSCLLKMTRARCRHLPVFEGDRYLGMISMRDVMDADADELRGEIQELREYVAGSQVA